MDTCTLCFQTHENGRHRLPVCSMVSAFADVVYDDYIAYVAGRHAAH